MYVGIDSMSVEKRFYTKKKRVIAVRIGNSIHTVFTIERSKKLIFVYL